MLIRSLRMKNIRSYKEQQIEFPEGSVLLAGDIGSGKSSILHAVEFALFGARRDSISGEALLRKGEREGEVELSFSLDCKEVTIRRKLKRQQESVAQDAGFIVIDGKRIDGTATELKARLLDLLGYPKEFLTKSKSLIYRYTVYTPQEEMKQIITEPDEVRVDTLRKVFGIDRYKRIAGNASLYIQWIKETKKGLAGAMQGLDEKKAELEKKRLEAEVVANSLKEVLQKLGAVMSGKDQSKAQLTSLEEKIARLNELRKKASVCDARLMEIVRNRSRNNVETEQVQAEIEQLAKRIETMAVSERKHPPADEIEKGLTQKEKTLAEHTSMKAGLNERQRQLERRLELLKTDITAKKEKTSVTQKKELLYKELLDEVMDKKAVSDAVTKVNMKLKDTEAIIADLNACKKAAEQLKRQVSSLETCPTCRQEVTQVHKQAIITEEDRKIQKAEAELEGLSKERDTVLTMLAAHEKRMQQLAEKEREIAAVKVEIANLNTVNAELEQLVKAQKELDEEKLGMMKSLEKLDDRILQKIGGEIAADKQLLREIQKQMMELNEKKHAEQMLAEREQRKKQLERQQEILKDEVKQINAEKLAISEESTKMGAVEQDFSKVKQEYESILQEEKRIEVMIGESKKEKEGILTQIAMLSKDIASKEEASLRLTRLNAVQEWLENMLINLMSVMERQIMARVHAQFGELFSTWFSMLIEEENLSARIDDNFLPVVMQNGYDTSLDHLSGGERTSVALAYRLALNRVINDVVGNIKTKDLLILDEPTDGFSSEQLDKVRNVLDELNVKQTIIVSHESKIESFVDHVIRIHKTEHVSRVVS